MVRKNYPKTTTRVELGDDGKYRWTYALNMYKNPAILLTVLKIIVILFSIPLIFVLIRTAISNDWANAWGDNMWHSSIKILLFVLVLFIGITLLAYLIVAGMYGGKYIVHFTMDEKTLVHATDGAQSKKSRRMGLVTMGAGVLSGRAGTISAGMAATRTTSTTDLSSVRRIKVRRGINLIKVNQLLNHNQVYVPAEDFDLVLDFLRKHCPKAK